MRILAIGAVTVVLAAGLALGRTWTDRTGTFHVEAELVAVQEGKVQLRKADGSTLSVPLARLSEADRRYLASLKQPASESSAAAKPETPAERPAKPKPPAAAKKGKKAALRGSPGDAIAAALNSPTRLEFVQTPLRDVVNYLKDLHGVEIQIDRKGLEDVGVADNTPITITSGNKERLAAALDKLLAPLSLQWLVRNEVVLITTPETADRWLETWVYRILRGRQGDFDSVIQQITAQIEPKSWDSVGGPGSIAPWMSDGLMSVAISQTQKVHGLIEQRYAGSLRRIDPGKAMPGRRKGKPASGLGTKLAQRADCDCADMPLREVAAYLADQYKLPITIDENAFRAIQAPRAVRKPSRKPLPQPPPQGRRQGRGQGPKAGPSPDMRITLHVRGISLRSVLSLITEANSMAWVPTQDGVEMTTLEAAETKLTPVLYDVRDLLAASRDRDLLVALITSTIRPPSWNSVGGPGSIAPAQGGAGLQVNQISRVHEQIEQLLLALRLASRP